MECKPKPVPATTATLKTDLRKNTELDAAGTRLQQKHNGRFNWLVATTHPTLATITSVLSSYNAQATEGSLAIEAGEDIISAVNEFSSLIASTIRAASPTMADESGLGIPQSTKKVSCSAQTALSELEATLKRHVNDCAHLPLQLIGTKRKLPHATLAPSD